ncbi:alanine/glycine:cation symporter family protein [Dialister sp.]|uniref:alanine/glycine:cation symporter family protein n=1 Tax=Dialister sp. TaxID=1955814 RepID=UPI002E8215EF|nr:amino acid carrier protein [Dialister sp.]MEE3453019.1 amino acid carrier protein [Dialister sp.]
MEGLFAALNAVLSFVTPVSDFFWDFPKMFGFWKAIPVLGSFSLAIIVLVGSGIYFTLRLGFIQVRLFKRGVKTLSQKRSTNTGISPMAAFLLSTAMRVGPGNMIGVTGAIAAGGPGALFWMWISAFFGMATAFTEGTLAQIFKEKRGKDFVGGLPFYARVLCGNKIWVGTLLSLVYIIYALMCLPAQGFNVVVSSGAIAGTLIGAQIPVQSTFFYIASVVVIILMVYLAFGGIHRVSHWSDILVPVMAVIYVLTAILLIITNVGSVPYFFGAVFAGAFKPEAVFGGAVGVALLQGVKRGLMSNEAGQGTITMAAASAEAKHPCEQGIISALGVFLDTHVICTMTGFIIVMAHEWGENPEAWKAAGTYAKFLLSVNGLTPGALQSIIQIMVSVCFCLFAFTCVLGFISFSEISANRIASSKGFINFIRILCVFVAAFGIACNIAGYDLSNLWAFSDLGNIIIVYCNIPMLYLGIKYVVRAARQYSLDEEAKFISEKVLGIKTAYWNEDDED